MSRVLVFLFVSVVLTADMSSGEYYSLTLEERNLYLQGVIEGMQIVRILAEQHKPDIVYRLDPVLEELRQGIIMGIEPHMISRLVREIRKQYGYR
tara:strand:+ start:37 stop:321 length:285 start_codon:yes stop_codon:yes gene_type:complete